MNTKKRCFGALVLSSWALAACGTAPGSVPVELELAVVLVGEGEGSDAAITLNGEAVSTGSLVFEYTSLDEALEQELVFEVTEGGEVVDRQTVVPLESCVDMRGLLFDDDELEGAQVIAEERELPLLTAGGLAAVEASGVAPGSCTTCTLSNGSARGICAN